MKRWFWFATLCSSLAASAAPVIDPIPNASIPAGKSLIIPVTATTPNSRALTFTATSSTNRITVEIHTNNPFWKMSVVQVAASNAPGAYLTPFRGGLAMVTNVGDMTFMLFKDITPHTVDVFQGLTMGGYFNSNTIFHRVIPGFVIQGGDPDTNGSGGPVFLDDNEFHSRAIFSGNGQLAIANSGNDTDGSQFFVTFGPQRFLDFRYTLCGQLLRGFNVASNIVNTPRNSTDGTDRPYADVVLTRVSIVSNSTDTVITLSGTNLAGVSGTIKVIADDGAGGKTTNSFTATTVSDATNNSPPILINSALTNRIVAVNGRLTNFIYSLDLENNKKYFESYFVDQNAFDNSTFALYPGTNGLFILVPKSGYSGPLRIYVAVAPNSTFSTYDYQEYTFAVGDTAISALGTNLVAQTLIPFTNQLMATFTNRVPNSAPTNFTAFINWGDNSTNSGVIVTNVSGRKEVRGSHTYTNSGNYPVYITIQSQLGAEATVVATATVPPALKLTRNGTNNTIHWPAWAFDYTLQSHTNLSTTNWTTLTNLAGLSGYDNVITNTSNASNLFFRLKR